MDNICDDWHAVMKKAQKFSYVQSLGQDSRRKYPYFEGSQIPLWRGIG